MMSIKQQLKQIAWLRAIVRKIKKICHDIYRFYRKKYVILILKKEKKIQHEKIRVGFVAQIAWSWDKLQPLYEYLKECEIFETYLYVVPEDDFKTHDIIPDYKDNYFVKKYPESICLLSKDGSCMDIIRDELDYLFYQRPFDYRIPKSIRSSRMVHYTRCCYLPYGFTASDAFDGNNFYNEFFDNQYLLFMDSKYMRDKFRKRYQYSFKKGIKKIEYLGYPALEKYIQWGEEELARGYITWTPRWSFDAKQGGSTFLLYKDNFLKFTEEYPGKYLFRPHPLIHAELISQGILTEKEWRNYLCRLEKNGVLIDTTSAIDDILRKTELLITDFSTIIGNFLMMGRPIIYCDNGIVFNKVYQEIEKTLYIAHEWSDVRAITNKIMDGIDPMKSVRKQYIEKYKGYSGASERIANYIKKDAMERGWQWIEK